jgi:hypothetical protein
MMMPLCAPPIQDRERVILGIKGYAFGIPGFLPIPIYEFAEEDAYYKFSPTYRTKISEYIQKKKEQENAEFAELKLRKEIPDPFTSGGAACLGALVVIWAMAFKMSAQERNEASWLEPVLKGMFGLLGLGALYWGTDMSIKNYRCDVFQKAAEDAQQQSKAILDTMETMAQHPQHVHRMPKAQWEKEHQQWDEQYRDTNEFVFGEWKK